MLLKIIFKDGCEERRKTGAWTCKDLCTVRHYHYERHYQYQSEIIKKYRIKRRKNNSVFVSIVFLTIFMALIIQLQYVAVIWFNRFTLRISILGFFRKKYFSSYYYDYFFFYNFKVFDSLNFGSCNCLQN